MGQKLGQHFLINTETAVRIVNGANINDNMTILEIGPGRGAITALLIRRAKMVYAIERDHGLVMGLKKELKSAHNLHVFEGNALDPQEIPEISRLKALNDVYHIVANIPYYITGKLLRNFLFPKNFISPQTITIMVQKEVGERMLMKERKKFKSSLLGISIDIYGIPNFLFYVPRTEFSPQPKVDSMVLHIEKKKVSILTIHKIAEEEFFSFLKIGYRNKRKKIRTSYKSFLTMLSAVRDTQIFLDMRPEHLCTNDWIKLFLASRVNRIRK